ncbi:ABC transporter ATP-binding protein [uncultured Hydrogenophaga sp.]|uniref:ABC transporter ATP-binding protein n=1 Tax=uncultured Hydrogenophaga sp. TaxID=199683 RepID=UPI0025863DD3|nr:ABC transporter ATP-binding protein [uncultured Hydrogenophaga sp.]
MNHNLLDVRDLQVRFGGIVALDGVSLSVRRGSFTGLIGPNGAGKTTLFNALSGLVGVARGELSFDGRDLRAMPPYAMAGAGIGRTFQNLALLPERSVLENVLLGAQARLPGGFFSHLLPRRSQRRDEESAREEGESLLQRLGLLALAGQPVGGLPFGTKKRVELGRALMMRPQLLLLDEPACGLNPAEVGALRELILELRDAYALTVLLIEHHMPLVMSTCEHVEVMNFGRIIARGAPAEVTANEAVVAAYLGTPKRSAQKEARDAATA